MPELEQLYYDKYDYDSGEFKGMTTQMENIYRNDLQSFYKLFTGNSSLPETIHKFSDIKLKDYYNSPNCKNKTYDEPVTGRSSDSKFYNYIENVRSLLDATNKYHNALLNILEEIFVYKIDPDTGTKEVTIKSLTDNLLSELTRSTITNINNLYKSCEAHYINGVELYIDIKNKQLLKTSKSQISNLENIKDAFILGNNPENISSDDIKETLPQLDETPSDSMVPQVDSLPPQLDETPSDSMVPQVDSLPPQLDETPSDSMVPQLMIPSSTSTR